MTTTGLPATGCASILQAFAAFVADRSGSALRPIDLAPQVPKKSKKTPYALDYPRAFIEGWVQPTHDLSFVKSTGEFHPPYLEHTGLIPEKLPRRHRAFSILLAKPV